MTNKLTFSLLVSILSQGLLSQQPDFITEKYFPDPGIRFNTPTLSIEEDRFATYDEIRRWIEDSIAVHPNARIEIIGTTPLGREVPVIYLTNGPPTGKIKVWMQGLLHGNEPAGGEALLYLANRILTTAQGSEYLANMEIAILPIANVDGYIAMNRRSGGGYDLNRDQTKFADPVSKMIKKAYIDWQADIAFDFHEFQPTRREFSGIGQKGASTAYDVLFLPSGYLNIPEGLRRASKDIFQKEAEKALEEHGYSHNFYFTANVSGDEMILNKGAQSPHSSSTSYALSNAVSMLVETRGIGLGRTSFTRRTHSTYIVASSFLESAVHHKDEIQDIVASARETTIAATEEMAVLNEPSIYNTGVNFIDMETGELITLDLKIRDAENLTPTLTRTRPAGYMLEGNCIREAEILSLLGLEVKQITKRKRYRVESFVIRIYKEADVEWERIKTVDATADLIVQKKVFPKGSYYVDLHQKNANYAISVLEPESLNGFVSYRVTPTSDGDTLKIHRVVRK
jgi:hypothetical protein